MKEKYLHSDAQIWTRLIHGDRAAMDEIIRHYYSDMYFFGLKISRSKELTEDCIQELLVDLWVKRGRLSKIQSIKPYLLKSLRRRIIRTLTYDEPDTYTDSFLNDSFLLTDFSVEDKIIQQQTNEDNRRFLLKALERLSKRQREIVYLKFYQKLEYSDIAKVMSLKKQSVHNLLQEAIMSLKKHISEPGNITFMALIKLFSHQF